jgi:hypothetical protein
MTLNEAAAIPTGACVHPTHLEYIAAQDALADLYHRRVRQGREHRAAVARMDAARKTAQAHVAEAHR